MGLGRKNSLVNGLFIASSFAIKKTMLLGNAALGSRLGIIKSNNAKIGEQREERGERKQSEEDYYVSHPMIAISLTVSSCSGMLNM